MFGRHSFGELLSTFRGPCGFFSVLFAAAIVLAAIALATGGSLLAQDAPAGPSGGPRPVPPLQILPLPHDQASFEWQGSEILRYHFAPTLRRPFIYPIIGPSGRPLTRMGHPRDPAGHSHHNSFWISHHDVAGVSFWGDTGTGRILQRRIELYEDGETSARLAAHNEWINEAEKRTLLDERREITLEKLSKQGEWLLIVDLELTAKSSPVTFGKTSFGIVGVRMAKTIGVHDGGGKIRNSAGGVDEKEVFWKPARWVDYSGPITDKAMEGIALFDHPMNPNFPSVFHVRDDGWMGASLTYDAPRTIQAGEPLRLRYALYVHQGMPEPDAIAGVWEGFSQTKPRPKPEKKK